jgi:hypothetical protein
MTTQDQNKKTLRQFQCRDYLWETFEQMSGELECSVDYLINEAMRQYARSRNYGAGRGTGDAPVPQQAAAPVPTPVSQQVVNPVMPAAAPIPSLRGNAPARPSMPVPPPRPMRPAMPQAPQGMSSAPPPRATATMSGQPTMPQPNTGRQSLPPPLPPTGGRAPSQLQQPPAQPQGQRTVLYAIFNGQKIPVAKDEFIIGRGSKSADLAIKDGNISRRHAAVVFHNGAYYMKDLGSTNGIEYQGRRFDTKRIDEGDAFRICDYEIRFTYA